MREIFSFDLLRWNVPDSLVGGYQPPYFHGDGFIAGEGAGIVTVDGSPASRELELRDRETRMSLKTTMSGLDGTYRFDRLDSSREYDIIARDHTRTYVDVVVPAIRPKSDKIRLKEKLPTFQMHKMNFSSLVYGGTPPYNVSSTGVYAEIDENNVLRLTLDEVTEYTTYQVWINDDKYNELIITGAIHPVVSESSLDPHYDNVALLINGAGDIRDAIGNQIVNNGGVTNIMDDPDFPDGGIRITGGNYLYIADQEFFNFPGDFTIEFDYKPLSKPNSDPTIISMYDQYAVNGGITFFDRHTTAPTEFSVAVNGLHPRLTIPFAGDGVKNSFRYVRTGSTMRAYLNDVEVSTHEVGTMLLQPVGGIWIGTEGGTRSNIRFVDGIFGRIRITKHVARTEPQGTDLFPEG